MMDILKRLTEEFKIQPYQTENAVKLLDEGNTVPFIARYRKEVTGSLDDQLLRELSDRLTYLRNLEKRKEEVKASIEEQGKLTDELVAALEAADTLTEVEDIYRPYKPHRKTRASIAREKGLEPLAEIIFAQEMKDGDINVIAAEYIDEEKGVNNTEEAIAGAMDIIAENISDNAEFRKDIRRMTFQYGLLKTKQATDEDTVYSMYYDYSEAVSKMPG
ncbi:MAG: RNA-binding transcriptional accessory protein, partial [Clostridia bacterium]|nr:RNA-binding transcriptional accessory protein [Clostridia bacterium]